jgi:predicted small lipoprotein YifL
LIRRSLLLLTAIALALPLAACGRKGNPDWPDDSIYPRKYPYTPFTGQAPAVPTQNDYLPPVERQTPQYLDLHHPAAANPSLPELPERQ